MRFSMLYSGEQILSFKSCLVFYAGDSFNIPGRQRFRKKKIYRPVSAGTSML